MERTPAETVLFALSYYPFPLLLFGVVTGTWWLIGVGLTMSAIGLTGFWIRQNRTAIRPLEQPPKRADIIVGKE